MAKTFLTEWAKEKPFIILRDRIYEVSNTSQNPGRCLVIGTSKNGLSESEPFLNLENLFMDQEVQKALAKYNRSRDKQEKAWREKIAHMADEVKRSRIEESIENFLNSWSRGGRIITNLEKPDISQYLAEVPESISFHPKSARRSVMLDLLQEGGLLLINGDVYRLAECSPQRQRSFLLFDNKILQITYFSSLHELEQQYLSMLKKALSGRISSFSKIQQKMFDALKRVYEEQTKKARALPPENATGEVGYLKDGNDYWVYINKPSYTIASPAVGKTFRFPSCKIGLRLIFQKGKLDYDRSLKTRILAASEVSNGREEGNVKNYKGKWYVHPATYAPESDQFTYLCITGGGYSYPQPSGKRSLEKCLREILIRAHSAIETGYRDRDQGAYLYHYLDEPIFERFQVR